MFKTFRKKAVAKITSIFFLLFPIIILSQIFPKENYEIGGLIPKNYKLKNLQMGDLNNDNQDDLVLIITNLKTKNKSVAVYYFDLKLKIWKLKSESINFFKYNDDDIFKKTSSRWQNPTDKITYEEFVSVVIKNQIITIGTNDGYGNSIYISLRLNKVDKYEIIGIDTASYPRHYTYDDSINYLTSKMKTTKTIIGASSDGEDVIEVNWFKVLNLKKWFFKDFTVGDFYENKNIFIKNKIEI